MTHDELLELANTDELRALIELHKPKQSKYLAGSHYGLLYVGCSFCFSKSVFGKKNNSNHLKYPCPTIQAIEKELT